MHYFQIISSVQLVLCVFSICSNISTETVSYEIISSPIAFPALTNCRERTHLDVIMKCMFHLQTTGFLICPKHPLVGIELLWCMSGLNTNSLKHDS